MNYSCPLCGTDLKRAKPFQEPLKGELELLAIRWHLVCPSCDGALMDNPHPSEEAFFPVAMLGVALVNVVSYFTSSEASFSTFLASVALMFVLAYLVRAHATPEDWQRYVPWREEL